MAAYSLQFCVADESIERAASLAWCYEGMLGSEELNVNGATVLRCYFSSPGPMHCFEYALMSEKIASHFLVSLVPDQDYNAGWRKSMEPALIAKGVWASPTWLPPKKAKQDDIWIAIEPAMAFGTGHHETTRLAAKAILSLRNQYSAATRLLDIGTGSGLLCFLACRLGAGCAIGVEIDPVCCENISRNSRDNPGISGSRFFIGTIDAFKDSSCFDVTVMNMILTESAPLLQRIAQMSRSDSMLIWSGLLLIDKDPAVRAAKEHGFALSTESQEGEWWCGVFVRY